MSEDPDGQGGDDGSAFGEACTALRAHSMAGLMNAVPSSRFTELIQQTEHNTGNSLMHVAADADFSGALRYLILQCNHASGFIARKPHTHALLQQNHKGQTALHIAMQRGNVSVIAVLRDAADRLGLLADVCAIRDADGRDVLRSAATPDLQALIPVPVAPIVLDRDSITSTHSSPDEGRAATHPSTPEAPTTITLNITAPPHNIPPHPSPPSPEAVRHSQELQQILALQERMVTMLERLPEALHPTPPRQLQAPNSLDEMTATGAATISSHRLLHMLVLAGESSERNGLERDYLRGWMHISERFHREIRPHRHGRTTPRAPSIIPDPVAVVSTQQFRTDATSGSDRCSVAATSVESTTQQHHLPVSSTHTYHTGRSTTSVKDAATCTSPPPPDAVGRRPEEIERDHLDRSVLMVHGERHVAGQELDLLVQWRGEEGEEWAPLSDVRDYAVVQAYIARKRGSSSTYDGGTPVSSAEGFARMGSPLGETERDDLSQQLAALKRVSTGGGIESAGAMGGEWAMVQWYPMVPPSLEQLFDQGRMEPSLVAIQADLLNAAITLADIGQTPPPTGSSPLAWNGGPPSSAGGVVPPSRSNLTPVQRNYPPPQRRGRPLQTPLGFSSNRAPLRHSSSDLPHRWGGMMHNTPPISKRVSRELPPRRTNEVSLPPSRGMLPGEYQVADLHYDDEVLPPPPARTRRGEGALSPQELLRALEQSQASEEEEDSPTLVSQRVDSPNDDEPTPTRLSRTPTEMETEAILAHYEERMSDLERRHQACRERATGHPSGIPRPPKPESPSRAILRLQSPEDEPRSWQSLNSSVASDIRNVLASREDAPPVKHEGQPYIPIKYDQQFAYKGKPKRAQSTSPTKLVANSSDIPVVLQPILQSAPLRRSHSEISTPSIRLVEAAAPRASTALPPLATGSPGHLPPALKNGGTRSSPGSAVGGPRQVRFEDSGDIQPPDESKLPWIPKYGAPPPSRPSRLAPLD